MNEKAVWTIVVFVVSIVALAASTTRTPTVAQETPATVDTPDQGGTITIVGGANPFSRPNRPGKITLVDAGFSTAACTSCRAPLSYEQPELPSDTYLAQAHVFPCFDCGQIHLVGELRRWSSQPGTSLVTYPPTWAKWTWRDGRWEPWK